MGQRKSRHKMIEVLHGEVHLEPYEIGWSGRRVLLAYLFKPGTREEMLPRLESARVIRVREALTIAGLEAVPRGRKSVDHFKQTWVCAAAPIAPERWPPLVRRAPSTGFDPEDDNVDDLPAT